jgi:hypothetical protein
MEERGFGPVTDRNVDCLILLLRSTIIKKPAFKRRADQNLERHFLDIFNEPTISRIRGFFKNESISKSLWLNHIQHGRLQESVQVFCDKNEGSNMTPKILLDNLGFLGAPIEE